MVTYFCTFTEQLEVNLPVNQNLKYRMELDFQYVNIAFSYPHAQKPD